GPGPRARDPPAARARQPSGASRSPLPRMLRGRSRCPAASVARGRARGRGSVIETLPPPLRRAVSPYVGIVRGVEECLASTSEPRFFQAACEVGTGPGLLGVELDHLSGIGGAGRTRGEAAAAAVGEAVERYSATFVPQERLVVARARDLPGA